MGQLGSEGDPVSARLLTKADREFFISEALRESKSSTDVCMRMYWPDNMYVCVGKLGRCAY